MVKGARKRYKAMTLLFSLGEFPEAHTTSAAVDVTWGVSLLIALRKTHRAGWKPHSAELLPFMLAQKPKH